MTDILDVTTNGEAAPPTVDVDTSAPPLVLLGAPPPPPRPEGRSSVWSWVYAMWFRWLAQQPREKRRRMPRRRCTWRLLAEQRVHRLAPRAATSLTWLEREVVALAVSIAQRVEARLARRLDRRAHEVDWLDSKVHRADDHIVRIADRKFRSPEGSGKTAAELEKGHNRLDKERQRDEDKGSVRHARVSPRRRAVPKLAFLIDFLLLTWFMGGITNVDWSDIPLTPENFVFAVLISLLIEVFAYATFTFTGRRLRRHKADDGSLDLGALPFETKLIIGLAAAVLVALAGLMFDRMHSEVIVHLGEQATLAADLLAVTICALSIAVNTMIIIINAEDGSDLTDRIESYFHAMRRPARRIAIQRWWQSRLKAEIRVHVRRAGRLKERARHREGRLLAQADRVIDGARAVHQACGPLSTPTDPDREDNGPIGYETRPVKVDTRAVDRIWEHLESTLKANS